MRIGIEEKYKDIYSILEILNSSVNQEVKLDDVLFKMVSNNVSSSDLLFLILKRLKRDGYLDGEIGSLKILDKISNEEVEKISFEIENEIRRNKTLFVTPLEIGKFYMCPRRLFLEKIALSKQFKEAFGKTWNGEVLHLAINLFVKKLGEKEVENSIEEVVKQAIEKYGERATLDVETVKDFVRSFYDMVKEENFVEIYTEKYFESFQTGLVGTPDLICVKENGAIVPVDIKLGKISSRGLKEEHILQSIGEAILVEDFFRKEVKYSYLIYFGSNSIEKIDLSEWDKRRFIGYKKKIEMIGKSSYIPDKTMVENSKRRICAGCHVKPACVNIEKLRRIYY